MKRNWNSLTSFIANWIAIKHCRTTWTSELCAALFCCLLFSFFFNLKVFVLSSWEEGEEAANNLIYKGFQDKTDIQYIQFGFTENKVPMNFWTSLLNRTDIYKTVDQSIIRFGQMFTKAQRILIGCVRLYVIHAVGYLMRGLCEHVHRCQQRCSDLLLRISRIHHWNWKSVTYVNLWCDEEKLAKDFAYWQWHKWWALSRDYRRPLNTLFIW